MQGVSLDYQEQSNELTLRLNPAEFEKELDAKAVNRHITTGEYAKLYLSETEIKTACDQANHRFKTNDFEKVEAKIGEIRHAEVEFRIPEDAMIATLSVTAPYGGKTPSLAAIMKMADKSGITRGLGNKRVKQVLTKLKKASPGQLVESVVAKGLPVKDGHSSRVKPLVPNALERVLRPQATSASRVDMRNLGEVICVKAGTEVLRRKPPSKGRAGYTVKGDVIEPNAGEWQSIKLGDGTAISDHDENLVIATISGMPKFKDLVMTVDDTYTCQGVNVGTGNVNYDGAVLVNGDVTEKMVIVATGDVTINGFVESASIHAGGDIVITEGAMGKANDEGTEFSCELKATGSIHVQHGQGLDIKCGGNITVGRQVAYSRLECKGDIIVGQADNPNGNLFACTVVSQKSIRAGTLGAVSGSTLSIDFSKGFNLLMERKDVLDDILNQLRENNSKHKDKIDLIKTKLIPKNMRGKVDEAIEMFENEAQLLNWLEVKNLEMKQAKDDYTREIMLMAFKRVYSGVSVKLNNRVWRSEREYGRSKVHYDDHQWEYDPIT